MRVKPMRADPLFHRKIILKCVLIHAATKDTFFYDYRFNNMFTKNNIVDN